ncbi:MAG: energy-coupling factor transporter ATPase [Parasporobacterium sp.]|nr:energy-coupling factor transporter ATPase [Parasporobacterium sp.]
MIITLEKVNYIYNPGTVNARQALRDVNLTIREGEFIALAGSTGSGKSTLVQILNGLKVPSSGSVSYDSSVLANDRKELQKIRCRIGVVFQYPEYQLFDETVLKDVSYGPKNKGLSEPEALEKAKEALQQVGLPEETYEKSPFDLSGGEKRRAAIAGILAMEPEVLILDEPTAGLDPLGKEEILDLVRRYQENNHSTVIMVTHNMDEAAEYASRIIVMENGFVLMDGESHEVFSHPEKLREAGLDIPQAEQLCLSLGLEGNITIEEAVQAICAKYAILPE